MSNYTFVNGSNYYNEKSFAEICKHLESGEVVKVGIDCIGHSLNNALQEEYREHLEQKYGDKLIVECSEGVCSYSYKYQLLKDGDPV